MRCNKLNVSDLKVMVLSVMFHEKRGDGTLHFPTYDTLTEHFYLQTAKMNFDLKVSKTSK